VTSPTQGSDLPLLCAPPQSNGTTPGQPSTPAKSAATSSKLAVGADERCWLCRGFRAVAVHEQWTARRREGRPDAPALWTAHPPISSSHPVRPCPACAAGQVDSAAEHAALIADAIRAAAHDCPYGCGCDDDAPITVTCGSDGQVLAVEGHPEAFAEVAERAMRPVLDQQAAELSTATREAIRYYERAVTAEREVDRLRGLLALAEAAAPATNDLARRQRERAEAAESKLANRSDLP
jgi:hypothetical protein